MTGRAGRWGANRENASCRPRLRATWATRESMTRLIVFGSSLALLTLAAAFAGVGVLMRVAIANASYDPIRDDGYAGTVEDFNARLLQRVIAACLVAAASGVVVFLTRPRGIGHQFQQAR